MAENFEILKDIKNNKELRQFLDALRQRLDVQELVKNDPIQFVHKFQGRNDIEIAGFFASHLAFGRVKMIIKNLEKLFSLMQWKPYEFVMNFNRESGRFLSGFVHRFVKGNDIVKIVYSLKEIYSENGGLEEFFLRGYSKEDKDLQNAIYKFTENFYSLKSLKDMMQKAKSGSENSGIYFLLPPPGSKSAYKRLNLFLRWMVRQEDGLDTGLWKRIRPSQLIIPLDTHIARISKNLGLTQRKTPDIKMAIEITENLKMLDGEDPLKYDFVLCHAGISEGCTGKYNKKTCDVCKIREWCVV